MHSRLLYNFFNFTAKGCVELSCGVNQCQKLYLHCASKSTTHSLASLPLQSLQYSSDSPPKCWKCSFPHKSELFCSKCKSLQKLPKDLNYFDIIGVKEDYNVENAEIQQKYRQLQNILHPDRFSNKSVKEKEISEHISSMINKAYSTLIHPLERGLYLLRLNNINISKDTTNLDPEFLMEIMERNEKVEAASQSKDEVVKLMKENREILDELTKEVSDAFHNADNEKAKTILIRMKYYASIDARLKELKRKLGVVD